MIGCFNFPAGGGNPISDINRSVTVVSPLPSAWSKFGGVIASYRVRMEVLDAGVWTTFGSASAEAALNQPLVPQVHAPIQLRVQGTPANQIVTASAASPLTVTWQPSAAPPAATSYQVRVVRLTKLSGGSISRSTRASAQTRGSSFTFPPGFLVPAGTVYQLRVQAQVSSAPESAPFSGRLSSFADAITNPFIAQ